MQKTNYKSRKENYNEALIEARQMTIAEIKNNLRWADAFHQWAIDALKQALKEKENRQWKNN